MLGMRIIPIGVKPQQRLYHIERVIGKNNTNYWRIWLSIYGGARNALSTPPAERMGSWLELYDDGLVVAVTSLPDHENVVDVKPKDG